MILSDRDIMAAMTRIFDPLIIDPPVDVIQPASVDVTLGRTFDGWTVPDMLGQWCITPGEPWSYTVPDDDTTWTYTLMPGECLLASTEQTIRVPTDMVAQITGKSSLGRMFLTIHATAGFIDPGFHGKVTLELRNNWIMPIVLKPDMAIGQLVFTQMVQSCLRPYGTEGLGSHYQGQDRTTRSYLETSN